MKLSQVIIKPLITESALAKTADYKYTFVVDKRANKNIIKQAVEKLFKVDVKRVWVSNILGKKKKTGRGMKLITKEPDWKKAIVKLAKDQKIEIFDIGDK
jgi:large subunit ribosomal protein L23